MERRARREAFYTGLLTEGGLIVARAALDAGLKRNAVRMRLLLPSIKLGWFLTTEVTASPLADRQSGEDGHYDVRGRYLDAQSGTIHEVQRSGTSATLNMYGVDPDEVDIARCLAHAKDRPQLVVGSDAELTRAKEQLTFFAIANGLAIDLGP